MIIFLEIIFFAISILSIIWLAKTKRRELLTFALPGFLLFFFIDAMGVANSKYVFNDSLHPPFILNVPIIIPLSWVYVLCFLLFLNNKFFSKLPNFKNNIIALSALSGLVGTLFDLIADPLFVKIGSWSYYHYNPYNPFIFGVPIWNFIGWFLGLFIFFLGYYSFRKFGFKKRILFTYGYISLILIIRFFIYRI